MCAMKRHDHSSSLIVHAYLGINNQTGDVTWLESIGSSMHPTLRRHRGLEFRGWWVALYASHVARDYNFRYLSVSPLPTFARPLITAFTKAGRASTCNPSQRREAGL